MTRYEYFTERKEHDFLCGLSNMTAIETVVEAILSAPQDGFPVYLYGFESTGKSHLLRTVAEIYAKEEYAK